VTADYYVIAINQDGIDTQGPFESKDERDREARRHWIAMNRMAAAIFWQDVEDGSVLCGSYTAGFLSGSAVTRADLPCPFCGENASALCTIYREPLMPYGPLAIEAIVRDGPRVDGELPQLECENGHAYTHPSFTVQDYWRLVKTFETL